MVRLFFELEMLQILTRAFLLKIIINVVYSGSFKYDKVLLK